jgi:tetratricopeptide (TPR) repeat protein
MRKKQWLIVIIAVIVGGVLYTFPKYVIDNDSESGIPENDDISSKSPISENDEASHSIKKDSSDIVSINSLKLKLERETNNEKKFTFADSLASAYQISREFDSAIHFAKVALELGKSDLAKEKLGNVYFDAMSFSLNLQNTQAYGNKARSIYEGLLEGQTDRLDLKTKIAMTFIASENPMNGIMMLREVLEEDPNNLEATMNLGMLSIQSGQFDKAVGRFEKAVKLNPTNVQAWYYLGYSHKELGNADKAIEALNKAKSLDADPEVQASVEDLLKDI